MTEQLPDFLSLEAILIYQEDKGESFKYISLLCEEHGLIRCLWRKKKKGNVKYKSPDFLDFGQWDLQKSKDSNLWYLNDYDPQKLFVSISKNYRGFSAAAYWCRFLNQNLVHTEWLPDMYSICVQGFKGWISGYDANVVLLKCFYIFCKQEGFPIKEMWLKTLNSNLTDFAHECLFTPLKNDYEIPSSKELLDSLLNWMSLHTDLKVDTHAN